MKEFAVILVTAVVVRAGGKLVISFVLPIKKAKSNNAKSCKKTKFCLFMIAKFNVVYS